MDAQIQVPAEVKAAIEYLAATWHVTEGEVIRLLIDRMRTETTNQSPPPPDEPVAIYAIYMDTRVTGLYHPTTAAVTVTSPPCQGRRFRRPSPAATAVVTALNPDVDKPVVNGWLFWRITATGYVLDTRRTWRGRTAHVDSPPS